jgi:hypothetical protein
LEKRVIQFNNCIIKLNNHFKLSLSSALQTQSAPAQFSFNNRWLCGFRDRDGSFGLYLGTRSDNGN